MKFKKFGNKWVVSINIGEEIVETLKKFCKDNNMRLKELLSDFIIWKLKNIILKNWMEITKSPAYWGISLPWTEKYIFIYISL